MHYMKTKKKCSALVVGFLAIFSVCVGFALFKRSHKAEPSLRFVSIIFRHGERAPDKPLPPGLHEDAIFWPEGLGALLQRGKENMFELGRSLRYRYDGFLSSKYIPAGIAVISSDVDRCIMSAQLLLAGLYPPEGIQKWNPDLPWQPVPVHSLPPECDKLIKVTSHCPLLMEERRKRLQRLKEIVEENEEFLSYLSQKTGVVITRNLIKDVLSKMKQKTDSEAKFSRRLNVYSGHDFTLISFWQNANISQEITDQPLNGAALLIELHEINGKYRVKILYKKHPKDEDLLVLKTVACQNYSPEDDMCDFDTFSSALQSSIFTDFDAACQIPNEQ
ncbi:testicular acid phosphatase homolog isoform X2 [Bemisia tabaci]|uniref:testicular acid phosphatase homolog isoform X2 n=1 Tax=Bemisia tabaci TaxID=7038 RepID=UPI003B2872F9